MWCAGCEQSVLNGGLRHYAESPSCRKPDQSHLSREYAKWPEHRYGAFKRKCWGCSEVFYAHVPLARYCSDDCKASYRKRAVDRRNTRPCETCSETFTATRSDGRHCSSACRQKAYRQRVTDDQTAAVTVCLPVTRGRGVTDKKGVTVTQLLPVTGTEA